MAGMKVRAMIKAEKTPKDEYIPKSLTGMMDVKANDPNPAIVVRPARSTGIPILPKTPKTIWV